MNALACRAQIIAAFFSVAFVAGCGAAGSNSDPILDAGRQDVSRQFAPSRHGAATRRFLYISLFNNNPEVDVYPAGLHIKNPKPIRKITDGITRPQGVAVDKAGTLYVVNSASNGPGNVVEYANGSSTPSATIPNIPNAQYVAVDDQGFVYVSGAGNFGNNSNPVQVFVYAPQTAKLVRTITFAGATTYDIPGAVALDSQGDVFVGQLHRVTRDFQICMATAGSTTGSLYIDGTVGADLAIDGSGTMYVGNFSATAPSKISVYPPGATTPSRSIVGGEALSVASDGTLYGGYIDNDEFDEYAPGAQSPTNSFKYGTYGAVGSALTR